MPAKNLCVLPTLLVAATLALPFAVSAEGPESSVTACKEAAPEILEGRVVDAAGRPIPGAEVWEVPKPHKALPVSLAVSGTDGSFVTRGVDPRSAVEVCRDGYLVEVLRRPLGARPAEVVLHPVSRISGRVLAPDGSPVPGAAVSAWDSRSVPSDVIGFPAPRPCPRSDPSGETSTDAEGQFILEPLGPGQYDVAATAPGYRTTGSGRHFDLGPGAEIAGVEVRFEPGAVLPKSEPVAEAVVHGRITTAKGDPVAGAEVSVANDTASTRSDARGAYRLTGVAPSTHEIWAVTEEDGIFTRSTSHSIEVAPGENRLDLTLPPLGREVRGRVLAPDGTPVAGALLHPENGCPERAVPRPHTAADGSFVIHLPAGTRRLLATLEGYSPGGIDVPGEKPVVGAVIRLTPDRGLSGRILGAEPEELREEGRVELERVDESGQPRWCTFGKVEPVGRYRFPGLWPGEWTVTAKVDGRTLKGRVKLTPGAEAHLDLTLPPKLAVHGRVVDEGGQPIAGAVVQLKRYDSGPEWGTSAADGTFVVRVKNSGTWTARADRAGFISTSGEPVEVAAPKPRAIELVMARGAVLRVRVPEGQVVRSVWAHGRSGAPVEGEADASGGYLLSGVPPGVWRITAELSQPAVKVIKRVTLGPETRELTVDLAVPQGSLTFSGSLGWVSAVILKRQGDPEVEFSTAPAVDETFHFSGLPAGSYLLEFDTGRGYRIIKGEVELDAGREVVHHLRDGEWDTPALAFLNDR